MEPRIRRIFAIVGASLLGFDRFESSSILFCPRLINLMNIHLVYFHFI